MAVDKQKLIKGGKVLQDAQTVAELGISESDFLVCMVTKDAKTKASAPVSNPASSPLSTQTTATIAPAPAPAPAPIPASAPAPAAPAQIPLATTVHSSPPSSTASPFETPEAVAALSSMGFPEAECKAALTAAMGNPDLAYEFLNTGIPENLPRSVPVGSSATTTPSISTPSAPAPAGLADLNQLRTHPQFNMLKTLVQNEPARLPQVLQVLGQQSPSLLAAITANEEAFLAMMNEPIAANQAPTVASPAPAPAIGTVGDMGGMSSPAQVMQMLATLPPDQQRAFAQSIGMAPEQLQGLMQALSSMPPDDLQQLLGGRGMAGAGAGIPPGANVIRLTEEEMASVQRLMALGFTQQQAVQVSDF